MNKTTTSIVFQTVLLLIAAASAGATYWLPPIIIAVGVTALLAYAVERYVTFKEQDLDDLVNERVKQADKQVRADLNSRLTSLEEDVRYATNAAERASAREGFGG